MSSVLFDLASQPHVAVPTCPVCDTPNGPRPVFDRYGFTIGVSTCTQCGLAYLNPRMTAAGYAAFYGGPYRALVRTLFPRNPCPPLPERQRSNGGVVAGILSRLVHVAGDVDLLDAGGSTGEFAAGFCETMPMRSVTVLDPSAEELEHAASLGFGTIKGTIESAVYPVQYGAILCHQTLDHVLEPLVALQRLREALAPGGWLWIDVLLYRKWHGMHVPGVPCFKLDHPLNWTKGALHRALSKTGWKLVAYVSYGGGCRYGVIAEGT